MSKKVHETNTDNPIDFPIDDTLEGYETIELRFDREELYRLMLLAHEHDLTLNQFIEKVLRKFIDEENAKLQADSDVKQYESDDGPLSKDQLKQIKKLSKRKNKNE